ncbi:MULTISPECIES: hypothetical protein [unclassified Saccharothrix]|uniref:hypothetical protein n=1 Tax=unclassified Saccharothrix TaxID=2593673 RepID=UPI00307EC978
MGEFKANVEALHGVSNTYVKVGDDLADTIQQSQPLASVQPPMRDPATTAFAAAVSQAGRAHLDSVTAVEGLVRAQGEEVGAATDQYSTTEDGVNAMMGGRG